MERVIKKYKNRKYYDTHDKKYINLKDIEGMIKENEGIVIQDVESGEDLTRQTMAQIILKHDEHQPPVENLHEWITAGGKSLKKIFEKTLAAGKEVASRIEKDIQSFHEKVTSGSLVSLIDLDNVTHHLDSINSWTVSIFDEKIRKYLIQIPSSGDIAGINKKIDQLKDQVDALKKEFR